MNTTELRLSSAQIEAVLSDDRAIVVVAGAGSGKTEVVASRVERLLKDSASSASRVLALSYTLKAADELSSRFKSRLGDLCRRVDTNTVHSFAHSLLRQQGTRIGLPPEPEVLVRDEDRAELMVRWLRAEGRSIPEDLSSIFRELDVNRAKLQSATFLEEWEASLASAGALDYASMLTLATEVLRLRSAKHQMSRLYSHVIVDEAQNLTAAQYQLLTTLIGEPTASPRHLSAMLVGDEKQSIVSFAGADPTLIGRFEKEYGATRFELSHNFRSAEAIVRLGETVARRLGQLDAGTALTTQYAAPGIVDTYEAADEFAEAKFVTEWALKLLREGLPKAALAPGESGVVRSDEIAILGRSAASLRTIQATLEAAGHQPAISSAPEDWLSTLPGKIAFEFLAMRTASSHQSTYWQLNRLLGSDQLELTSPQQLRTAREARADPQLLPLIPLLDVPSPREFVKAIAQLDLPEGLGEPLIAAWDGDRAQLVDAWQAFVQQVDASEQTWGNFRLHISRRQRGDDLAPGVRLLTIHKAQGREFPAVAVVGLNDGQLPDFRAVSQEDLISELRAFYVAISRASRLLLLTRPNARKTKYGMRQAEPSPYLQLAYEAG